MSVLTLLFRLTPGVSMAMNVLPSSSNRTSTLSRVVPGISLTITRSAWVSVLMNVLFPVLRRPQIAIFITGHVIVGLLLELQFHFEIAPWIYLATLVPLALILPMAMLSSIKGAVVGLQWATRMHGFDPAHRSADRAAGKISV